MNKTFHIRHGSRIGFRRSFVYYGKGLAGEGSLWELSNSGSRVTGHDRLAPGIETSVSLALPDKGGSKQVSIDAAIVGWDTTETDAASRARIRDFLEQAGDDEDRDGTCAAIVPSNKWEDRSRGSLTLLFRSSRPPRD